MVHIQPLVVVHQLMQSSPVGRGRGELGDKNNQIADEEDEDVVHDDHHTTTKVKYQNYPMVQGPMPSQYFKSKQRMNSTTFRRFI